MGEPESWNEQVIREFRAGRQEIKGGYRRGDLLLLTTTGARTGATRVTPLACFAFEDDLLISATAGGSDRQPDWFRNLTAHPQVHVEHWSGDTLRRFAAHADVVSGGPERERLWAYICEREPGFAGAQARTDRVIPVIRLRAA